MTAIANAMAESFVDTFKTELIKDRVWQTRAQLELAILEYVDWFNNRRLHESLGDIPPVEFETNWQTSASRGQPAAVDVPACDHTSIDITRPGQNGSQEEPGPAKTAPNQSADESSQAGLCDEIVLTTTNPPKTY
ncbi:MAG: IS3 family transposase [Solirubrobacteraceae bacterium]